jgi:hypothetical protein
MRTTIGSIFIKRKQRVNISTKKLKEKKETQRKMLRKKTVTLLKISTTPPKQKIQAN